MSKRQLGSKYSKLVKYINERKDNLEIMEICKDIFEETNIWNQDTLYFPRNKEYKMISQIYNDGFDWPERDKLVPIIVDIYNDNYELEEPKYYWKLKEPERVNKYAVYFGLIDGELPVIFDVTQKGRAKKCTKSELNKYLLDTKLTVDSFTPVEEIEND